MPENNGTTTTKTQEIVFVTHSHHTLWVEDPDHPQATDKFLEDCRKNGWPILRTGRRAYVFASGEWPA